MNSHYFKKVTMLWALIALKMLIPTAHAVSCGDSVVGTVRLTSDLNCSSGYTALEVANHNVVIDLNGFTLSGDRGLSGVNINEYDNIVVKNGSIKGFWGGVNSSRSDKLTVNNVTFYEVGYGIIVSAGNNARIENNRFAKTSSTAISISVRDRGHTANRNRINQNEFYRVAGGVSICGDQADYNVIANNLVWKSSGYGIHLNHSDRNRLYRNRIIETPDFSALRLNNSSYNQVTDNAFQGGGHIGISVLGNAGDGCLATAYQNSVKNRFTSNQLSGFKSAFVLGLGEGATSTVIGNGLLNNRITDNNVGVFSQPDTRHNYGRNNNFTSTNTPIVDLGVNNQY